MGRELKRVPMDFNWPIGKIWEGYLNPYPAPITCEVCEGSGYNEATNQIANEFYDSDGPWRYEYYVSPDGKPAQRPPWRIIGITRRWCDSITQDEVQALVDASRLYDFTHVWTGERWERRSDSYVPTADEVNRWNAGGGFGHDAINRSILIEARAKRLGVWGECPVCDGKGETPYPNPEDAAKYDDWQKCEPPTGGGYQLWETTSEGSARSPVFATLEALCAWCETNATTFADFRATAAEWFEMLSPGKMVHHQEGNAIFI